ncbi:CsbD family protein [Streptomyces tauricus]
MSKAKSKAKQMKGKMKEATGKAMDDQSMEGQGRGEQMTGKSEELKDRAAGHMKKSGR